jgi:hypothetical protein
MQGRRVRDATRKERHVCARRRDGEPARRRDSEAAGTVSGRERRRCLQIVCRSRTALLGQTPRPRGRAATACRCE